MLTVNPEFNIESIVKVRNNIGVLLCKTFIDFSQNSVHSATLWRSRELTHFLFPAPAARMLTFTLLLSFTVQCIDSTAFTSIVPNTTLFYKVTLLSKSCKPL